MDYIKQLEYDKIKAILAEECQSEVGKAIALKLRPERNKPAIELKLKRAHETIELHSYGHSVNFEELTVIDDIFEEPFHGVLNFEEFQAICRNVITSNLLKSCEEEFRPYELTSKRLNKILGLPHIEEKFKKTFGPEGEVLDTASGNLRSIRRNKQKTRTDIMKILNRKLNDSGSQKFIQEKIITQRDDRYVIPIKESSAPFVKGIVQGRSTSKSSVYVEPEEVVGSNNTLRLLGEQEKQEIYKILKEFTGMILEAKDAILENTKIMAEFDYYFAIARYAKTFKAEIPKLVEEARIKLIHARHPLLIHQFKNIQKVIPFDMELGEDYNLLILSGPNTGGKTITMKAVGLLTMMALSGLPIPADEDSEIGLFKAFYTDIGDGQSLENSLSTFSSHIANIRFMLEKARGRSLVLIDEIGAATDPEQGSAIAQAVLETLARKNVKGIITTHYTALKVFAEQSKTCMNASMQFDSEKLTPTYKFVPGLPGDSFAIEVAENLGMKKGFIDRAKKLAGTQNIEFTEILSKLEEQKKLHARQKYEFELKTRLYEKKIDELNDKIEQVEEEKTTIRKKALKDARNYLTTMQKELNNDLTEIRKLDKQERKEKSKQSLTKVVRLQKKIKEEFEEIDPQGRGKIKNPRIGQKVWLANFETEALITDLKNGKVIVDMDGIAFTTEVGNLYTPNIQADPKKSEALVRQPDTTEKSFKTELKLLGLTFSDSQPLIDEFIDNAVLGGLNKLRIVHGKGTGVLRNKVRYYLKRMKQVKSIHTPSADVGGDGVTVVVLK